MDTKKINYRAECLDVMNFPEAPPDSVILKSLQSLIAQWHPDRNKFTDNEARKPPIQRKVAWMKNTIFATVLKFT